MNALDRKLLRDLRLLAGQLVTVALVVACGIASYVAAVSTEAALEHSRAAYYERSRFADVFVSLKRAPAPLEARLREIPGVAQLETRVVEDVLLDMPALPEPAVGRLISLPAHGPALLNVVHLRAGRLPERGRDETVVSEAFARAHHLQPGSTVAAVINGRRETLRVVGVGLSPEYVYSLRVGDVTPDDRRFGALWVDRRLLEAAFQMEGAFNDVSVRLGPDASAAAVIDALDRALEPYGGQGAYARERQLSERFVSSELAQLATMARVVPGIFLAVAAFLVNVVFSRLIGTQRQQIAALKALGYGNGAIARHYFAFALLTVLIGTALGLAIGAWTGSSLTNLYGRYFRFPLLAWRLEPRTLILSLVVSLGAALAGVGRAVQQAVTLPPAEAMRPPSPPSYKRTLLERLGVHRLFSAQARMVLRDLERRPLRLALSSLGIALAVAILIVGRFSTDAVDVLVAIEFETAQREDLTVTFLEPRASGALSELRHLPGVLAVEPMRSVPVRLRGGPRERTVPLIGLAHGSTLRRVVDVHGRPVVLPNEGVVLSRRLGTILGVGPGDRVRVEVLEGERTKRSVPVAALVDDLVGLSAYMDLAALHRLLDEERVLSGAFLAIDPRAESRLFARIKELPHVASVTRRTQTSEYFRSETARYTLVFTAFLAVFAAVIAVGVVYNNARIAFAERAHDLASLRVLGLTRREVSAILLGEQAVQILLALPLGLLIGRALSAAVVRGMDTELFALPLVVSARTNAFAVSVVLAAGVVSALLVRRRVDQLDLIGVLKAQE